MLWEQFATLARDWMKRLPPAEARAALAAVLAATVANAHEVDIDAAIAQALAESAPAPEVEAESAAAPVPAGKAEPEIVPAQRRRPTKHSAAKRTSVRSGGAGKALQPVGKRARALVREQLKHGPKPAAQIEAAAQAAEIPKAVLLAATDELGVRTQRGQWWLPG
jgi:hypothetical protein